MLSKESCRTSGDVRPFKKSRGLTHYQFERIDWINQNYKNWVEKEVNMELSTSTYYADRRLRRPKKHTNLSADIRGKSKKFELT